MLEETIKPREAGIGERRKGESFPTIVWIRQCKGQRNWPEKSVLGGGIECWVSALSTRRLCQVLKENCGRFWDLRRWLISPINWLIFYSGMCKEVLKKNCVLEWKSIAGKEWVEPSLCLRSRQHYYSLSVFETCGRTCSERAGDLSHNSWHCIWFMSLGEQSCSVPIVQNGRYIMHSFFPHNNSYLCEVCLCAMIFR
jgi:hypothetical protein